MWLLIRILQILLAIAIVVGCYYLVVWVLGLLGIHVPQQIMTVAFVIVGLCAALGVLTGRMDNWWAWRPGPPA